jgi:hypothetical protein
LSLVELAEPIQENSLESAHCSTAADSSNTRPLRFEGASHCDKPPTPKFSRFVCSPHEVETFLWMMIDACGLSHWWGRESTHNEEIVRNSLSLTSPCCQPSDKKVLMTTMTDIHRIVNLRMFEKISLHQLVQNLKFKACDQWISRNLQDHYSVEMLHDFLWWFYFSFIGGLLKVSYYDFPSCLCIDPFPASRILSLSPSLQVSGTGPYIFAWMTGSKSAVR